jgi:ABC-2 type transport system ATP-binding protein
VIIQTINLTKRYGKLVALNGLHLNIEEGECFGYIGPNGAGNSHPLDAAPADLG